MRNWNLALGDPLTLTLCADQRLCQIDPFDDHIFELNLLGGEPPALTLQSTLGLRVRWLRFFPQFQLKNDTACDPRQFYQTPRITAFFPSLLSVTYSPYKNLDIAAEYWIPASKTACGRLTFANTGGQHRTYRFSWVGQLNPISGGASFTTLKEGGTTFLKTELEGQSLVCLLNANCGASKGALPALALEIDLPPGARRQITWCYAAAPSQAQALANARTVFQKSLDADFARVEQVNASQSLEITTGIPAWDAALAMSQKTAFSLFFPGAPQLPHPTLVRAREPDHGFSARRDGSDLPMLWKGCTALDVYYLSNLVLPDGAPWLKGLVRNFLSTQDLTGHIHWQPTWVGSNSAQLAQPLLASLAWKIHQVEPDSAWLAEVFPALYNFIKVWFDREHDCDGDGFPEWAHPLQTGLDDLPLFDRWHPAGQGVDIAALECPSLASFLASDINSLKNMAHVLQLPVEMEWLDQRLSTLAAGVQQTWDKKENHYSYRDCKTHQTHTPKYERVVQGSGEVRLSKRFSTPQRIQLTYQSQIQATRPMSVELFGKSEEEETQETLPARRWHWSSAHAAITSQQVFTMLDRVVVNGVLPKDAITLRTINYTQDDITLLLPLWAGIASSDHARLASARLQMLAPTLGYGLPVCAADTCPEDLPLLNGVSPLWNSFIIEGLANCGCLNLAADLYGKLMDAITQSLATRHAFYEFYDSGSGAPGGQRNHLHGLAPVGLILNLAGLQLLSKNQIILNHFSPFSLPITVKYHRIEIQLHPTHAVVTFPNGQSACINEPGVHLISLSPVNDSLTALAHPGTG